MKREPDDEMPIIPRRLVDFQTELIAERRRAAELLRAEQSRAAELLLAERSRAAALQNELRTVTLSMTWRLSKPIRWLARLFPRFARLVRGGLKVIWWTLTLQLISRLSPNTHTPVVGKLGPTSDLFRRLLPWNKHTDVNEHPADVSEDKATWSISEMIGTADGAEAIEAHPGNRKLICITHLLHWPPRTEKGHFLHRMLSWAAASGWDIVLLVSPVASQEPGEGAIKGLAAVYPNLVIVPRDGSVLYRLSEGGSDLAKLEGKVVAAPPDQALERVNIDNLVNMERTFADDRLMAMLHVLSSALDPAVILVDHVLLTQALANLPGSVLKLIRTGDVVSRSEDAVRLGAPDGASITREKAARLLARADVIIAADAKEKFILSELIPGKPVITAGVSGDIRPPHSVPTKNAILLVASDRPAQVKGAADFLRFAWPIVKRSVPDVELLVAGAICQKMESTDPHIKRAGAVRDLVDLYAQAKVVINPAIAGRDFAIETLEAFSNLRPLVAWPRAIDGIDPALGQLCYIATNWYDFAMKVVAVLSDPSAINRIEIERDLISQVTSPDHVYAELSAVLGHPKI